MFNAPDAKLFCKGCKRDRPASDFLWNGRRGKIRVRLCNECSGANMKRYWATKMVGRKPEEFANIED